MRLRERRGTVLTLARHEGDGREMRERPCQLVRTPEGSSSGDRSIPDVDIHLAARA